MSRILLQLAWSCLQKLAFDRSVVFLAAYVGAPHPRGCQDGHHGHGRSRRRITTPTTIREQARKARRKSLPMTSLQTLLQPLLTVAVVHLLAAMSPGPSFITVSRTALTSGRPAALASALACGFGVLPWAIGAMLGVVLMFKQAPMLYAALKVAGGLYLLYLAVMIWQHAASPISVADGASRQTLGRAFAETFLAQITNPKVAVFFSAVFVSVLPSDPPLWMMVAILAIVFANEAAWYSIVALGLSAVRPRALYLRLKPLLDHAMGALLSALGAKLLADASRRI